MPKGKTHLDIAMEALRESYADWRRSTLGRVTDRREEELLRDQIGRARELRVLEVGCGDGVLATKLAAAGAQVTGLDASFEMLAVARRQADTAGIVLELVEGDAEHIPFPDACFDLVLSVATLCFSPNPDRSIREMVRVLSPGGRLILGELARWNTWAALRRVKGWLGSSVWRTARFRTRGELEALTHGAGLGEISVTGAIYYPPLGAAARVLAPVEGTISAMTSSGAAFLVLAARKSQ